MALAVQSGTIFLGGSESANLGYAAAAVGDVDGDGWDDLLLGAPRTSARAPDGSFSDIFAGEAVLLHGGPGGFAPVVDLADPDAARRAVFGGSGDFVLFGSAVAGGDLDGDGRGDLLIGAPFRDSDGLVDSGGVRIVYGDGADQTGGVVHEWGGPAVRSYAGFSLGIVGDLDGDGFAEAAIGTPGASLDTRFGSGAVEILFGGGADRDFDAAASHPGRLVIHGGAALDHAGAALSGAGDFDGDGLGDLVIGAPLADGAKAESGAAFIVFGRSGGWSESLDLADPAAAGALRLAGGAYGDATGVSVAGAGDFNGDGIDDIVIGANEAGGRGAAFVVFGRASAGPGSLDLATLDGTTGFRIDGAAASDRFGTSVAGVGDVNGDGLDDILIGAPGADGSGGINAGAAMLVLGSSAAMPDRVSAGALGPGQAVLLQGAAAFDTAGITVASGGDVNGDGLADLLIGADHASPAGRSTAGAVYLVHGGGEILGALDALDGVADGRIALASVGAEVAVSGTAGTATEGGAQSGPESLEAPTAPDGSGLDGPGYTTDERAGTEPAPAAEPSSGALPREIAQDLEILSRAPDVDRFDFRDAGNSPSPDQGVARPPIPGQRVERPRSSESTLETVALGKPVDPWDNEPDPLDGWRPASAIAEAPDSFWLWGEAFSGLPDWTPDMLPDDGYW